MLSRLSFALAFAMNVGFACKCAEPTVSVAKEHADVVFRGTITEFRGFTLVQTLRSLLHPGNQGANNTKGTVVFHVARVWKGEVAESFEMPALEETTACIGFRPDFLKVGSDLLVYAKNLNGAYITDICARTRLAKDAKDLVELGPGEEPKKLQKQ